MWTLILMMHVALGDSGNSNSLTVSEGFQSKANCEIAGMAASNLARGTVKEIKYVCVSK